MLPNAYNFFPNYYENQLSYAQFLGIYQNSVNILNYSWNYMEQLRENPASTINSNMINTEISPTIKQQGPQSVLSDFQQNNIQIRLPSHSEKNENIKEHLKKYNNLKYYNPNDSPLLTDTKQYIPMQFQVGLEKNINSLFQKQKSVKNFRKLPIFNNQQEQPQSPFIIIKKNIENKQRRKWLLQRRLLKASLLKPSKPKEGIRKALLPLNLNKKKMLSKRKEFKECYISSTSKSDKQTKIQDGITAKKATSSSKNNKIQLNSHQQGMLTSIARAQILNLKTQINFQNNNTYCKKYNSHERQK